MQKWLNNEYEKDKKELEYDKKKILDEIKKLKKEDIIPIKTKEKKLSIWQKLKKVLMG
jgi:hypothetical protein